MSRTLLIATNSSELAPLSGFAVKVGLPFDAILLQGSSSDGFGSGKVFQANLSELPPADSLVASLALLTNDYSYIAGAATMAGKDFVARLAGLINAGMVSDVISVTSPTQFIRPVVAGTILATEEILTNLNCFTVRLSSFSGIPNGATSSEAVSMDVTGTTNRIQVHAGAGSRPDLTQAKVVVSGGRPLKDAETFEKLIGGLADKLAGAVGATRAAVDSGIAPNECQVGQTGKIVAPDLYIAAGISGSTQHMAGIKDSKCIVAINKDPDAPIFEFADFGIVADLYEAIPELMNNL
jgi:electron transfer flavoprotein alpha subunit